MKISKRFKVLIISMAVILLVVGCGVKDKETGKETLEEKESEDLFIEHKLGELELRSIPEDVVVFDYGILDTMDNLGLEDKIIGLPKKSVPEYMNKYKSEEYEDVGTLQEPNFERIFELEPDLIIISDRQADLYEEFEDIAPTLYISVMDGEYMDLFEENIRTLGKVFDKEDEAEEKYEEVSEKVDELHDLAQEKAGESLFLMANDGELSAYGEGSRFGVLFNEFGVSTVDKNIDASTHGQKVTYEYISEHDPDYIFVMDRAQIAGGDISAKDVMDNELMHTTKAYENDNIIYLNSPVWYVSSGGISSTEMMIEDILEGLK